MSEFDALCLTIESSVLPGFFYKYDVFLDNIDAILTGESMLNLHAKFCEDCDVKNEYVKEDFSCSHVVYDDIGVVIVNMPTKNIKKRRTAYFTYDCIDEKDIDKRAYFLVVEDNGKTEINYIAPLGEIYELGEYTGNRENEKMCIIGSYRKVVG